MITAEIPPASGAPRGAHAQSSRKRIAIATLLLTAAFVVTGAPTAAAAPVLAGNHVMFASDPPPPCRGDKPGVCPYLPSTQLNEQTTAG
jgi:hypothetical protein